ncbi:MAG: 5-formyltetrahydrofolate cyclo-ligase [Eubacteriales bacterium]|nr:5-formyltetrahydrofolate cyclo-ligase [Eubacteriales bacterium]
MSVKIQEEKRMLRKHYCDMRKKMAADFKSSLDIELASRFLTSDVYISSKTLLIYAATQYEAETREVINAALSVGKKVALPVCENEGKMFFYFITSLNDLKPGKFGIYEPVKSENNIVNDFEGSVCVVPGLSFDPKGNRLGLGGGYYDRFLENFTGTSVGFCYGSFVKWEIPAENHDIPVDVLVTEAYVRKTHDNK